MTSWAMVIDISKCTACYCCFIACKDEYWDNDYSPYSAAQPKHGQYWLTLIKKERGKYPYVKVAYMPVFCMQCDDAPCIKAAKDGAVYKRPDGIVIIDPQKAIGQKQIVDACPYKVVFWNEEKKLPQKCTFCIHRLEKGEIPRCVQACPSEALIFGDLEDPKSEVSKLINSGNVKVFHPEYDVKPRVYYLDLYKMTEYFLAGNVAFKDTDECAENVKVTLLNKRTGELKTVFTGCFGDFDFDGLKPGEYSLSFEFKDYRTETRDIDLKNDTYIGYVFLERA